MPSYEYVLDELKARIKAWDEEEEEESETNPYETLVQQLCTWLHQLPAIDEEIKISRRHPVSCAWR